MTYCVHLHPNVQQDIQQLLMLSNDSENPSREQHLLPWKLGMAGSYPSWRMVYSLQVCLDH